MQIRSRTRKVWEEIEKNFSNTFDCTRWKKKRGVQKFLEERKRSGGETSVANWNAIENSFLSARNVKRDKNAEIFSSFIRGPLEFFSLTPRGRINIRRGRKFTHSRGREYGGSGAIKTGRRRSSLFVERLERRHEWTLVNAPYEYTANLSTPSSIFHPRAF